MLRCQPVRASLAALGAIVCAGSICADDAVDYVRDVKPLLERHCYACHGPDEQESGLRLDTAASAVEGGYSGPAVIAGNSGESVLVQALRGEGDATAMPLDGDPLGDGEIAIIARWIDQGAVGPEDEEPTAGSSAASEHWAFQPVARPAVPAVERAAWVRGAIDAFVLARLEAEGIVPAAEADRQTLLRRVYLDLIGLPPTPAEQAAFLNDDRPDAYEQLVDRLLASPHYGERWGRHWLDQARYADSHGYTIDGPRSIWPYRDWVIDALNRDLPFDQFTIEQIAGDLLPEATQEQIVATGFHRNTLINQEGGTDDEQFRVEAVVDRVDTTGAVFLGLTIGCARCHDHKFEPISQRDYYRLFDFFNQCDEPQIKVPTPEQAQRDRELRREIAAVEKVLVEHDAEYAAALSQWEEMLDDDELAKLADEVRAALAVAAEERNDEQRQTVLAEYRKRDPRRTELEAEIAALRKQLPNIPTTMILSARNEPRQTHIMIRGDFLRPGKPVRADVPAVLPRLNLPSADAEATRLDLARWLVDPGNPLTPRVVANRVWLQYFGRGLVETENDFGRQGTPPSHPELLDWLAAELVESGWSMKHLHRLIVTSTTYRQSSAARPEMADRDPYNDLVARQARLRLEAETIRDVALAAAGLLSPKIGGPSVFPPQPDGVMRLAQVNREWQPSAGEDRFRRGMYTYFWRSTPHPFLKTFDAPDANTACTGRNRSNTPLQSLTLLNDEAFYEAAQALAVRVLKEAPPDDDARVCHAFRLCLNREPTKYEGLRILELLASQRAEPPQERELAGSGDEAGGDAGPFTLSAVVAARAGNALPTDELLAWTSVARVLMNLDEFITRE